MKTLVLPTGKLDVRILLMGEAKKGEVISTAGAKPGDRVLLGKGISIEAPGSGAVMCLFAFEAWFHSP